ncbi:MAG: universal stress protein [Gammaproteobacteria bacterium]|nr:universal stress protein [Gammaproteobacteria bacterium]
MADKKNILVAVDFSAVSAAALKTAVELAGKTGARVKALHILAMEDGDLPKNADPVYLEDLHMQQVQGAKIQLEEFVEKHVRRASDVEAEILSGEPQLEILRAAQAPGVEMIVMGTHGRTGLRELLVGSVAENVLRRAPIPVVMVRG